MLLEVCAGVCEGVGKAPITSIGRACRETHQSRSLQHNPEGILCIVTFEAHVALVRGSTGIAGLLRKTCNYVTIQPRDLDRPRTIKARGSACDALDKATEMVA
jgi:hypothetical protein